VDTPVVIVHSTDQITAVLCATDEASCEVLILSTPNAAASLGAGIFRAMIDLAQEKTPERSFVAALGCGRDAGNALAAIRCGIKAIVLSDDCPAYARVADIARQNNVCLLSPDVYGPQGGMSDGTTPLDLMEQPDPLAACREFLHTGKAVSIPAQRMTS